MVTSMRLMLGRRRATALDRLRALNIQEVREEDDILQRPFLNRTAGALFRALVAAVGQATPSRALAAVESRLVKAGNPRGIKANDFLTSLGIRAAITLACSWLLLRFLRQPSSKAWLLSTLIALVAAYLQWFRLGRSASGRQREIQRSLPDIMDLLMVSVEAGLAFDMALLRVVDKFKGAVSEEFQRALKEIQLGRSRKDALRDLADRAGVPELSALVSAIIQAEQLGVGVADVLRLQSDLIRDKRQQTIEEQAMKAPVKMLFPLVFFIFPSIFVVILGPAVLNIMKILLGSNMTGLP
jgi:tight adherence protein C